MLDSNKKLDVNFTFNSDNENSNILSSNKFHYSINKTISKCSKFKSTKQLKNNFNFNSDNRIKTKTVTISRKQSDKSKNSKSSKNETIRYINEKDEDLTNDNDI